MCWSKRKAMAPLGHWWLVCNIRPFRRRLNGLTTPGLPRNEPRLQPAPSLEKLPGPSIQILFWCTTWYIGHIVQTVSWLPFRRDVTGDLKKKKRKEPATSSWEQWDEAEHLTDYDTETRVLTLILRSHLSSFSSSASCSASAKPTTK